MRCRATKLILNDELAYKPGSVGNSHSSRHQVALMLKQSTQEPRGPRVYSSIWSCSGWGLPCHCCCQQRGALLPHHFTLTPHLQSKDSRWGAVYFLWHFPWTHVPQALPGTLPCGARTFLCVVLQQHSDCSASSMLIIPW